MVVSQNRGPQYGPQNIMVLIIGTPRMVPLILGNSHVDGLGVETLNPWAWGLGFGVSYRAGPSPSNRGIKAMGLGFRGVGFRV